ncbi:MAG: methylenetetrahydrofolate--tRNA-(uracil(54)-C(5))-methyltransferase (FADH(2)-oxidizing) TrmFO [Chitinispirillaceae bacterium]|nr:methylenetetrahydrofolate--tRNA-(uracil(54)-C(5))-methyltransferase (FADH(2)-oxidizing) TrmFO [Chitinispirillaceae bacterium]
MPSPGPVAVIGAGLAGAEASLVLARSGIAVDCFEMRPERMTPAHRTALPAELVCSNSFKSLALHTAHGVLKKELELLESPLLRVAHETAVPAGTALAVDRMRFASCVQELLTSHELVTIKRTEVTAPPPGYDACIIAAGPLVSDALAAWITRRFGAGMLHFYDAIAPIVSYESIDRDIAFFGSRDDKGGAGDYLNCPFTKEQYDAFYRALRDADRSVAHEFEKAVFFEACLPIEVMAARGEMALAFGPLKPVGFSDPRTGRRPFAICQLRRENEEGTCYNLVGFQTRLRQGEQQRVFRMIPGLERVEFLRFGSIHRNTYCESPRILSPDLSFKDDQTLFLAGQLCGAEGYTESIATGHMAALFAKARCTAAPVAQLPRESALGSMLHHITAPGTSAFSPTNVHFGLFPPLAGNNKRMRKKISRELIAQRAIGAIEQWKRGIEQVFPA